MEFGKKYETIGYDLNQSRIADLRQGVDRTKEIEAIELVSANRLSFTSSYEDVSNSNVYIITVPTPLDKSNNPDLRSIKEASNTVGSIMSTGDLIIFESTVYPGVTEDECVPILEQKSGLKFNEEFFVGYSPERINPGDKQHRLKSIVKVVSGSTPEAAEFIDDLYSSIITAGTYRAQSIKVAEAAKVIENTQRDLNIALMNELAIIFERLKINTQSVLDAAGTKWNFIDFKPGLVGGHCIGVDPYYLTHKAESVGYHPQLILAGRRINDGMGAYVAQKMVKSLLKKGLRVKEARLLVMGLTFKENCPDLRNTKVIDVINELKEYGTLVDVYDPWCDASEAMTEYKIRLTENLEMSHYDGVLVCVAHDDFKQMGIAKIKSFCRNEHVIFDLKNVFSSHTTDVRL